MGRIAVFIDNGYLKKIQKQLDIKADYHKLSIEIVGDEHNRFRTYVYDCPPYQSNPPTSDEAYYKSQFDSFKYNIQRLPRFEFRIGRLQLVRDEDGNVIRKKDGTPQLRQKGVDMALGIDLARLSSTRSIDQAIIVAGDSDYVPAILVAKQDGVLVTLYYSNINYVHDSLYDLCDDRIEITEKLLEKCRR